MTRPGAILSMDLSYWPTPSPGEAKHLLVLHDQFSTLIACAPLKFKNSALQSFCTKRGIMTHLTAAYTPMQNENVERANRTIGDDVRAMPTGGGMEAKHQAEAACSFVHTRNAMPRIFFLGSLHANGILLSLHLPYLTIFSV